jgi:hypothetical protein
MWKTKVGLGQFLLPLGFTGAVYASGLVPTPNDWGLLILPVCLVSAAYMRFWLPRHGGTAIAHPRSIGYRSPQIPWAIFWVTLLGHSTHYGYTVLPVAYPLIMAYYAFRFGALRAWSVFFYGGTVGSALYLNHLGVLGILWGSGHAVVTALGVDAFYNWDYKRRGVIIPGPDPEPDVEPA